MGDNMSPAFSTFVIDGPVRVTISITELGDGTLMVDAKVLDETGKIGDLRGLFFDVADESLISGLQVTGSSVTGTQFCEDGVSNLGAGNNVNGSIVNEYGKFDAGIAFGTAGIGKDDVREASFILSHQTADLACDFLAVQDFAVRLTSVGSEGGKRGDSLKLAGTSPDVADVNAPPEAVDDTTETDEETAVTLNLLANDSDPDGDALTVTSVDGHAAGVGFAVTSAAGRTGTATLGADGVLGFDPGSTFKDLGVGERDTITVSYEISDGNGGTATANATVTVHGLNDAPVAVDDLGETDEDTAVSLNLLANDSDPDGDALTVTSAGGHAAGVSFAVTSAGGRSGTATLGADGVLTVDPSGAFDDLGAGEVDTVSVLYEIADGNGGTATARATVLVHGLNDAPVALDDAYAVPETGLSVLDILANDSDPEGDPLTVTLLTQPVEGSVSVAPDGTVTFDPGTDFLGLSQGQTATVTFDYQISDGQFTDTASVTVTVRGQGAFDPGTVTERGVTTVGGRPVTATLDSDGKTNDGTADLHISVALGDLAQTKYNVIYVIDVSGSTGVAGSFGDTTILDAQIAALQDLTAEFMSLGLPEGSATITVLPFNSRALPTAPIDGQAYPREIFGDNEVLTEADVDASLAALHAGGETNYVSAVFAAMGTIQQLEAQRGDAVNLVYFLSDGNPFPANSQPVSLLTQVSAQLKAQASVHGVALGDLVDPKYVDALDNTGGAQLIRDDPTALNAVLREAPLDPRRDPRRRAHPLRCRWRGDRQLPLHRRRFRRDPARLRAERRGRRARPLRRPEQHGRAGRRLRPERRPGRRQHRQPGRGDRGRAAGQLRLLTRRRRAAACAAARAAARNVGWGFTPPLKSGCDTSPAAPRRRAPL